LDGFTLQVDVYAVTATSARAVTDAIAHAIELNAYVVRWGGESKDAATNLYRSSFDVDWLVPR
jgi:TPP-dependent pyruvate/acetoin dehydrogenase alpha subunit